MSFTGLEEFSTYTVTVTAVYDAFGATAMASSSEGITTLSAGIAIQSVLVFADLANYTTTLCSPHWNSS